jgi:hypothetical protein
MKRTGKPKYVKHYKDDRGKWRTYLRRPGESLVALPPLYSTEFWKAYNEALGGMGPKPGAGTLSALILDYYRSAEFKVLAQSTKDTYRRHLDRFRKEHGHRLMADLREQDPRSGGRSTGGSQQPARSPERADEVRRLGGIPGGQPGAVRQAGEA